MLERPAGENQDARDISSRHKNNKKQPFWGCFGTAYQSRTGDLLRERQLSWTTRRMRLFRWFPFRNRVQKYNFFPTWQTFCSIFLNYILLHIKHQSVANNIFSPNSPSAGCKNDIFIPRFSKNQPHEREEGLPLAIRLHSFETWAARQ